MIQIMHVYVARADPLITAVPLEVRHEAVLVALNNHGVLDTVEMSLRGFETDFELQQGETQ